MGVAGEQNMFGNMSVTIRRIICKNKNIGNKEPDLGTKFLNRERGVGPSC